MKWIPKILSLLILWGAVGGVITFVEPELIKDIIIPGSYLPFYTLLLITIWYTLAFITKTTWLSLLLSVTLVGSMVLTMLKLMHLGLAIVILLTLVIESWYIYSRHEKIYPANEQKNRDASL